jgi:hypothetical protein
MNQPFQEFTLVLGCPAYGGNFKLAAALGPYRTVFESKTSSVLFTFKDSGITEVYANLFTPKVAPGSPVLGLTIRRH